MHLFDSCSNYVTYLIMNYDTAWFIGLLCWIVFSPKANCFKSGQNHLFQAILDQLFWSRSEHEGFFLHKARLWSESECNCFCHLKFSQILVHLLSSSSQNSHSMHDREINMGQYIFFKLIWCNYMQQRKQHLHLQYVHRIRPALCSFLENYTTTQADDPDTYMCGTLWNIVLLRG